MSLSVHVKSLAKSSGVVEFVQSGCGAKEMLLSLPRGPYTTARTVNRTRVLMFDMHVDRLVETSSLMSSSSNAFSVDSLRPRMKKCIAEGIRNFNLKNNFERDDVSNYRVTLGLVESTADLHCHVEELPKPRNPPIIVEARPCGGRSNAKAKDSQWIKDRKVLEKAKGENVEEVLLVEDDGSVMEGTQTNFFAAVNGTLYTAGEGVLAGTIRNMVLDCCEKNSIPVKLTSPNINDVDAWEGAFITSTSRLVMPVNQVIVFPEGRQVKMPVVDNGSGIASRLMKLVQERLVESSSEVC